MPIAYPYRFSDWYGYDKDCTTVTQFPGSSGQMGIKFICDQSANTNCFLLMEVLGL